MKLSKEESNKRTKGVKQEKGVPWVTIISIALFLSLFLFGVNANEPQRVLEQSWNICLDCIGIG